MRIRKEYMEITSPTKHEAIAAQTKLVRVHTCAPGRRGQLERRVRRLVARPPRAYQQRNVRNEVHREECRREVREEERPLELFLAKNELQ